MIFTYTNNEHKDKTNTNLFPIDLAIRERNNRYEQLRFLYRDKQKSDSKDNIQSNTHLSCLFQCIFCNNIFIFLIKSPTRNHVGDCIVFVRFLLITIPSFLLSSYHMILSYTKLRILKS